MEAASIIIFADFLNPARLFGPIFDKELRVSSRRRRSYWLRSAYVVLLAVFVLYLWFAIIGVRNSGSTIYQVSRSSQIGRQAIIAIVWFQFVAAQLLAVVTLSSSISDEIRAGTLNVLLTTPINSFQIVTGKLFSKLLQVFLFVAMTLPLMAIVRVFGGIPWNYVVSSLFITLTATIFACSLSLLLSVFKRNVYRIIAIVIIGYSLAFGLLPFLCLLSPFKGIVNLLAYLNPFFSMIIQQSNPSIGFVWPLHCLVMLGVSALLLGISVWKIRYAALGAERSKSESGRIMDKDKEKETNHYYRHPGGIKRVTGSPIVWRETYEGSRVKRTASALAHILFGNYKGSRGKRTACTLAYILCVFAIPLLFIDDTIGAVIFVFAMIGTYLILLLRLSLATAGSIAGEKEARTLPILLATPLESRDIILGKIKAGISREMPLLILFLFLNCILYVSFEFRGIPGFLRLFCRLPVNAMGILFIVGAGSYFGTRMKTSTASIAATMASLFAVYILIGIFNPVRLIAIFGGSRFSSNPGVIYLVSAVSSIVSAILLGTIGVHLLTQATRKLRYNIF